MSSFVTAIIFALIFSVLVYFLLRNKFKKELEIHLAQKTDLERSFSDLKQALSSMPDVEKTEAEKKKAEEKNKKLWQMSEAVYKEKARVDKENEDLLVAKEKLAAEKAKVEEKVKKLWSQSTAIHKEKERINELKLEIEQKHQEIVDSVNYAKRIQEAILPDLNDIALNLPNSFILFKPRDIVSGDFYWFSHKNGKHIIAAVDCTGHGVPGAFMSMIGNTLLNEIVNEKGIIEPGQILHYLNDEVNRSLKQTRQDSESRDGMDVAICAFDFATSEVQYAGANRPLYYVKDEILNAIKADTSAETNSQPVDVKADVPAETRRVLVEVKADVPAETRRVLVEVKADKFAIGGLDYDVPKKFNTQTFQFQKGETLYISTDGFADQFSPHDKKLMTRKFKETLSGIQEKNMREQRDFLDKFIEDWKGNMEQTDDILVIGVRV